MPIEYGLGASAIDYDGKNIYVRITDIDDETSQFDFDKISSPSFLESKYLLNDGDILVARTGASVGKSYLHYNMQNSYFAGFLMRIRVSGHYPYFIYSQLKTNKFKKWLQIMSIRSGQPGINSKELGLFKIRVTDVKNEEKIGNIIKCIDQRIITQKKIIEDIELLKKQLRNNIFTDDHGNFIPLKKLYVKGKAGGTPKTTNREYYDGDIPFLSITDITNSGKYIDNCLKKISIKGLENSSAWIVPAGSLILSMYASVGLPCINKIELATSQAMFSMILKKGINIDYIYEYLNYFKENKLEAYLEKGTQSNINSNIVENILIPLPDEKTISKIVNILTSIDKKIDNEKSILQLYIKQKEYLLNKLFI